MSSCISRSDAGRELLTRSERQKARPHVLTQTTVTIPPHFPGAVKVRRKIMLGPYSHTPDELKETQVGRPLCYVLTGVSGSGKSTVSKLLAEKLSCPYFDGDDFHPQSNVEKMKRLTPLTDADREPWLASLAGLLEQHLNDARMCVLACSCLKRKYRILLCGAQGVDSGNIAFILLNPSREELLRRVEQRKSIGGHFMPPALLDSQLETLEVDQDTWVFNSGDPSEIVEAILENKTILPRQ